LGKNCGFAGVIEDSRSSGLAAKVFNELAGVFIKMARLFI
jgi:hypothetical protein